MKFQIPKRTYISRGKGEGKTEAIAFRLPNQLLEEVEDIAHEYGYPISLLVSFILDGYIAQIQPHSKLKYPDELGKDDLKMVSYRLDKALIGAIRAAAGSRDLNNTEVVAIALWTFLKANK